MPGNDAVLAVLGQSRSRWNVLAAEHDDTYYYTEENCRVNAPDAEVVTVQVEDGRARKVASSFIPMSECLGAVNAYEDFVALPLPDLYTVCEQLIRREGSEVSLQLDQNGLLQDCSWPGPGEPECFDNCGEGFYLRSLEFGIAEPAE